MVLKDWDAIPENLKNDEVKKYYDLISKKKVSLVIKRVFDILVSFIILLVVLPILLLIAIAIKIDSNGTVFFMQERVTEYGRIFKIFKFRTMVNDAERLGTQVTVDGDSRITRVGKFLRKFRVDEIPQLINILVGDMSFVGTRPEVPRYVECYTDEMKATLLMKAGVTSMASIKFKDEDKLLTQGGDVDEIYVKEVLPQKMTYNIEYLENFSFLNDVKLMFSTAMAVVKDG